MKKDPGFQKGAASGRISAEKASRLHLATQVDDPTDVPLSKIPRRFQLKKPNVDEAVYSSTLKGLAKVGIKNPKSYTAMWGQKKFGAFKNFQAMCTLDGVEEGFTPDTIRAYLNYLHEKFYSAGYLSAQWNLFKKIADDCGQPIDKEFWSKFKSVLAHCKEKIDNKVPVPPLLIEQLCQAANKVLTGYNRALAKVLFTTAWALAMRVSE